MTTGIIAWLNDKGAIIDKAELFSDAYLSYGGKEVFTAFAESRESDLFTDPDSKKELKGMTKDWYKDEGKGNNQFFPDYSYEIQGDTLKAYHNGKLFMTAERSDMEKWLWLADGNNEYILYDLLFYRPQLLMHKVPDNYMKAIADYVKTNDLDTLKRAKFALPKEMIELDDSHCLANSGMETAYRKRLKIGKNILDFIVTQDYFDRKWRIYVQLPFMRVPFTGKTFKCETSTVNEIRKYITESDEHVSILRSTSELMQVYEKAKRRISDESISSENLITEFKEALESFSASHSKWLYDKSYLSTSRLVNEFKSSLRKREEKESA